MTIRGNTFFTTSPTCIKCGQLVLGGNHICMTPQVNWSTSSSPPAPFCTICGAFHYTACEKLQEIEKKLDDILSRLDSE